MADLSGDISSTVPKSTRRMEPEPEEPIYSMSSEMATLHPNPTIDSSFLRFGSKNAQKHEGSKWVPSFLKYRVRFLILFIAMMYLTFTRANELTFNFSIICMTSNLTVNNDKPLDISPRESSIIFACIGVGALIASVPLCVLMKFLGARVLFSSLLAISAISTMLFSPMAKISPILMAPLRLLQGLSLASVMVIMGEVTAQWAPIDEIGKFMTFLSAASQFSLILTMPLSAFLCVEAGWSSAYYVLGLASGSVSILFFTLYRNSPDSHPFITADEISLITKGERTSRRVRKIPYREIVHSKAVWAVWIAFLGNSFGFQLIIQYMPIFMNKVLLVPIAQTGIAAFIPPLGQLCVKFIAVSICDRIHCISENLKLCIFNSIAMCGCGLFFLPLGFLSPNSFVAPIMCFTASISCLGIVTCGSLKSAALIARQFTPFVMAIVQLVICVGALLTPFMVTSLAPDNTIVQWKTVFFTICSILIVTNIIFCMLCSADPQPWTMASEKTHQADTVEFSQKSARP